MASPADPSEFAVAVAVGYAHVLDKIVGFLERTSALINPVVAVSLALPVLMVYLVFVTLAFAVRVAADGYAHIVACSGSGEVLSPAAVLGWVASVVIRLATFLVLFSALAVALFHLVSSPCSAQ